MLPGSDHSLAQTVFYYVFSCDIYGLLIYGIGLEISYVYQYPTTLLSYYFLEYTNEV